MKNINYKQLAITFCEVIKDNDSYCSFTQHKAIFVFNKIDNNQIVVNDFNDYDSLTSFILIKK